jgi:thioredoxin reductase
VIQTQVAIVGAGPAGLCAAIEAAKAGANVSIFDENPQPGGQLVKQIHKFFGSKDHRAGIRGMDIGRQLLKEAESLQVEIHLNAVVWGIFDHAVLGILEKGQIDHVSPQRLILATGATENNIVFPGWTLPGVMGAGAAQTLMNLHRILPGRRILMVGSGNVGLIVAYQLAQAGADVVALVEAAERVGGYAVHAAKIRRLGIPIFTSYTVREAWGENGVEKAVIVALNNHWIPLPGTERVLDVDTICIATGLSPLSELAWMAGCAFTYRAELGGHIPVHNERLETTVKNLYAAGDLTGIEEASTAMEEGRLAGAEAARSLGLIDENTAADRRAEIYSRLEELRKGPFGDFRQQAKESIFAGMVLTAY